MCHETSYWTGLVGCCLLAVTAAGCQRAESQGSQVGPPRVSVQHPQQRPIVDSDQYNGWLQAAETVDVRAHVRGHIQKVHFHDGDLVQQGQLLFELDPRPFQVAINETLAQAEAFQAQKTAAEKQVARNRELVKSGAASQRELEKSEADALAYDAQINATFQQAEKHKLDLEFSKIPAPIAGRVGRAMLTEGNLVNAGGSDPLLTTIVSVDPIYVYFNVDERSLQRYQKAGQDSGQKPTPVRDRKIAFFWGRDSEEDYPHEGLLDFADNRVDAATGTIEVRGVVKNDQGCLCPARACACGFPSATTIRQSWCLMWRSARTRTRSTCWSWTKRKWSNAGPSARGDCWRTACGSCRNRCPPCRPTTGSLSKACSVPG